jgi:mannosyl-glycoprotein endo-beta-N-acetylglucosaminidase
MKNNYLEDRYLQGSNVADSYSFYHWNLIDTFIYFSHHFVTIPPESWTNAAHENNVRMLGTIITEFDQGELLCRELFQDIDTYVDRLVELTVYYNFDGWLINIENKIESMDKLKYFVEKLTAGLKSIDPDLYQVIWYDSVIESGALNWQNELNDLNKHFFNTTDGFFVNYTWKENNLQNSKINASSRHSDVYVGIDVFGRGCLGNGGFNCGVALDEIKKADLSYALFAPGWLHECNDPKEFYKNSEKFWSSLHQCTSQRPIQHLPLVTSFSHSSSSNFFLGGRRIESSWNNLNLQSLLPVLSTSENDSKLEWCFDDGFYGGNSILVKPETNFKLFDLVARLESGTPLFVDYVVKTDSTSFEHFSIQIEYDLDNGDRKSLVLNDKVGKQASLDFNLVKFTTEQSEFGWASHSFRLETQRNLSLKSLTVANADQVNSAELGLIRLDSEKHKDLFSFESDYKVNVMTLDGQNYLTAVLKLTPLNEEKFKYFNIFISKNRNVDPGNSEDSSLVYAGATKSNVFYLCLKLNSNVEKDVTLSSSDAQLSFNVFVQFVDKGLRSLNRVGQVPMSNLCVHCPLVRAKDNKSTDLSFFDRLVYDFEFF